MSDDPTAPPSPNLLRRVTDRAVVDQLLDTDRLTRAEIAERTGISKPTVSESIRRLLDSAAVADAGEQHGKRGPAGRYYRLRRDIGCALAVSAGPDGLVAQLFDIRGELIRGIERPVPSPVTAASLNPLLRAVVAAAIADRTGPIRAAALSLAGPVDRRTGRLIRLPSSPFLTDELDPRGLLGPMLGTDLVIDNDVNWAAVAEHGEGNATDLDDFVYCHLGYGIGGALVRDGRVVTGTAGLAGEIAHVLTRGPRGEAIRLVECFELLDLRQPGTAAIDVPRLRRILAGASAADRRAGSAILGAVAGALASVSALINPAGIVIGGPWGSVDGLADRIAERFGAAAVITTTIRPAALGDDAPQTGARLSVTRRARESLYGALADGGQLSDHPGRTA